MVNEFGRIVELESEGTVIQVAPEMGFSLVRFVHNGIDVLDMSRRDEFLRIRKGLGPLILPHFNQAGERPTVDVSGFPNVEALAALGVHHPFQHGVGRYVPWRWTAHEERVRGELAAGTRVSGHTVAELCGFTFSACVEYRVRPDGLTISFEVAGERPVAAGIHFYYAVSDKSASGVRLPGAVEGGPRTIDLAHPIDQVFPVRAGAGDQVVSCELETPGYRLRTSFPVGGAEENSFGSLVVFSPEGGDFACVEPVSYVVGEENTKRRFQAAVELTVSATA